MESEVLKAYRVALYEVYTESGNFVFKVGERSPELIALLKSFSTECWAYLTAENPQSHILSSEENAVRTERLEQRLKERGFQFLKGQGRSLDHSWPPENSFLVLGVAEKEAVELAVEWNQKALLIGGSSGVPVLKVVSGH